MASCLKSAIDAAGRQLAGGAGRGMSSGGNACVLDVCGVGTASLHPKRELTFSATVSRLKLEPAPLGGSIFSVPRLFSHLSKTCSLRFYQSVASRPPLQVPVFGHKGKGQSQTPNSRAFSTSSPSPLSQREETKRHKKDRDGIDSIDGIIVDVKLEKGKREIGDQRDEDDKNDKNKSHKKYKDKMADRDVLPGNFKPRHYDLVIKDLDFTKWTYKGTVRIEGEVVEPTSAITVNTLELELSSASVSLEHAKSTEQYSSTSFRYDAKQQRTTIELPHELPRSSSAALSVEFVGQLNHDMAGFYRSQYKPAAPAAASVPRDQDFHYMFSTQFESCDARRAFPCFDEPNLKATFDFAIEVPDDQVALSNMPAKSEAEAGPGLKRVAFERTPVMSTYLLAWAVGDFEYIEALTERRYEGGRPVAVRVYTTRGLVEQGRWALEHAPKYIDFFSEQFGLDYPLPKADILAVHEFTHGAMENWGLVTYRTTAILFDEARSEARYRTRIAYVVAHELAHQWFGNLVTMDWWDELWLNEGFATWAGWLATGTLHPDWEVWAAFVNEGMESALKLDSIRASHPIQVPVRDALDVNQVFDAISYLKGCSVIRMLANHLGVAVFLRGVGLYLREHKYGNAKTDALWSALSKASGQDVNALMDSWIGKIGFPVVTITEDEEQQQQQQQQQQDKAAAAAALTQPLTIRQSRFLSTGDVKAEDDTTTWWVPLALRGLAGSQAKDDEASPLALAQRQEVVADVSRDFYLVNSKATGFYRVNYPPARLARLGTQLGRLATEDKISIAGSASVLAFSGQVDTPALLSFLRGFGGESHYRILNQALDCLSSLQSVFGGDPVIHQGLNAFILKLIDKPLATVGWDVPPGEDNNKSLLRSRLLLTAGLAGHPGVQEEALKRFAAYTANPKASPIHADLRRPVYRVGLKHRPAEAVAFLKKEWQTTEAPDGRETCLLVLPHITDEAIVAADLLPFLFNVAADAIPAADMHILAIGLATNRKTRPLLWSRIRDGWDLILKKIGGNPTVLDRFVRVTLSHFVDRAALDEIDAFFADKDTSAFNRTLETAKDSIRGRAAYRERDTVVLRDWLVANGYAQKGEDGQED